MKPYYETELGQLYHGDCLEVMKYLAESEVKVDAVICDPPYNTTSCDWDIMIPFEKMWSLINKIVKNDNVPIVLFGSEPFSSKLRMSNIDNYKYDWVWDKINCSNFALSKHQPLKHIENIMVFSKKRANYYPIGLKKINKVKDRGSGAKHNGTSLGTINLQEFTNYPKNVIKIFNDMDGYHPTQKPLELIKYLVETYSNDNDLILDFTSGSGTLAVACEQLNRRWICIEKEKKYCDITVQRLKEVQQTLF